MPGHHYYLPPMMRLMRDEVGQDVPDVQGQVTPYVGLGWRYATPPPTTQRQNGSDAATASFESRAQLPSCDGPVIHPYRGDDPMLMAQGLDPRAPRVVDMGSDRPDRAGRDSGDGRRPETPGNARDEVVCDATVGSPSSQDRVLQIDWWKHGNFPCKVALMPNGTR